LVALPAFASEPLPESSVERAERLKPVAVAIWEATDGDRAGYTRGQWAAVLASLAWHETRLAKYVQIGRCDLGRPGERCDNGRARGLWQQWRVACPAAWATEPGSPEALREGARCASRLMYAAHRRCVSRASTALQGAFSGYAGASCTLRDAPARERTAWQLAARLGG
jgi:hypothetical protein